jgi:urease accessory protein
MTRRVVADQVLLRLLQLTDTAFPTGAFAHSFGLETYVARGIVDTAGALEAFIANTLLHAIAPSDGVACVAAAQAGAGWEGLVQRLDRRLTAMKTVAEWREASQSLGTRFLRTATRLFTVPRAARYLAAIDAKQLHGHVSLAYGLICYDLTLPLPLALSAWFRHLCGCLVSVGVRLIPLGQTAGQVLLARLGTTIITAVERALRQGIDDMTSFAPGQELAGIIHRDVLATRLYIS